MKKVINILVPLILTAGVFTRVEAQRGGGSRSEHGDRRSSNVSQNRNERTQRPYSNTIRETRNVRENSVNNFNRSTIARSENTRTNAANTYRTINRNQQRNDVALLGERSRHTTLGVQQRAYRENTIGSERFVSRNVYNNYNNNYYRAYPRVFMPGPRYRILPRSFITINFGGYPYYYNDGLFYGLYGGYYEPLFPPPGITIRVLPFGYRRIFIGADLFYYYNGIYYRNRDKNTYEVVDAPMGATVSSLPKGAKSVVLNGEKLYELNGTYYKEDRNYKGETVYTVVGKNGEVNNSSNSTTDNNVPAASLNIGDVVNQLPEGSKVVTIHGEKLYVTPDDTYLKEESNGNIVQYKVVGK